MLFSCHSNHSYFTAAQPSIERHIFSAALPDLQNDLSTFTSAVRPLTDTSRPGYFSSSFSPEAGFYVLGYDGPAVPYSKIVKTDDAGQSFPPRRQCCGLHLRLC